MTNHSPEQMARAALLAINVGMKVLSARMLTFTAMLMAFSLCGWAMIAESYLHTAIAGMFAVLVFLPVLSKEARGDSDGAE